MEKKRNLLCKCSFCGSAYRGFQVQVEPNTICNMLQNAIEKVFLIRYDIKGCSRTDSKVHAKEFYFNFITEKSEKLYKTENIPKALNTYLPSDIVVLDCKEVEKDFHSRYFCLGKEYIYIIKNTKNKDPFDYDRVLYYNRPFNEKLVNQAAQLFVGEHDFSAFCSKYCNIENRV
ncbi:MAG: tRNA pseudouridine(38-40) synthase TruA, partial [Clostridia bacterium]